MADHDAPFAGGLAVGQPAAVNQVFQENVAVVDRGDDDVADLQDALVLLVAELGGRGGRQAPAVQLLQLLRVRLARLLGLLGLLLDVLPEGLEFVEVEGAGGFLVVLLEQLVLGFGVPHQLRRQVQRGVAEQRRELLQADLAVLVRVQLLEERLGVGVRHAQHLADWILAAAEQSDAAHRHGNIALDHHVGADVGVGVLQGRLQLGQRDAELLEALRVGVDLIALDGAAVAGHIDDAGDAAELALQHPVLQRLEVVEGVDVAALGVLGAVEGVAVDLAGRRLGRDLRRHVGGQRLQLRRYPVDDLLAGLLVVVGVVELQPHGGQAEQRLAADVGEVGHAGHGYFHRHADQALDLLRGGAGVQRVDLDNGRARVGVGLDVDVEERVHADAYQRQGRQNDDEWVVQRPPDHAMQHDDLSTSPERERGS